MLQNMRGSNIRMQVNYIIIPKGVSYQGRSKSKIIFIICLKYKFFIFKISKKKKENKYMFLNHKIEE